MWTEGVWMCVNVLCIGTRWCRNIALKSTAKMYGLANTAQRVGRVKEHVTEQRNWKTDSSTHTASVKVKC